MRNSLVFRLMGAFLLVIGIGAIVISALTSRAMREAFFLYTPHAAARYGRSDWLSICQRFMLKTRAGRA